MTTLRLPVDERSAGEAPLQHAVEHSASQRSEENSYAGQGSVLLDIGGDIGALVVTMPAELEGHEIEIRPLTKAFVDRHIHHDHPHTEHAHLVHVGVLGRPANGNVHYSAVFAELREGVYELYLRPAGAVQLTVRVKGGQVTEAVWPI
ncbi:hypothetical protein ACSMXN_18845 [Jatrophihabitans sp. DSM 45814]